MSARPLRTADLIADAVGEETILQMMDDLVDGLANLLGLKAAPARPEAPRLRVIGGRAAGVEGKRAEEVEDVTQ